LLALFSLLIEWEVAVFAEYLASPENKIWFRNLAQVGVFGIPAAVWSFTASYTLRSGAVRRWGSAVVAAVGAVGGVAAVLILTDGWHHWIRASVEFLPGPVGPELVVRNTHLGEAFVSLVYVTGGIAFARLALFALRDGRSQRFPFAIFLLAILIPMSYALYL